MKTVDLGLIVVGYNFVIGVLLILSSEKLGALAGHASKLYREKIARVTFISTLTLGSGIAALSAAIYIAFYLLKIGV